MKQHEPILWVLLAFLLVSGCQTAPHNVSETIGQGYATLTTVAHDVQAAFASNIINAAQANGLKAQLQVAKDTLDTARVAYQNGSATQAEGLANRAHTLLQAVITALENTKHGP